MRTERQSLYTWMLSIYYLPPNLYWYAACEGILEVENRQFTFNHLVKITNKFQTEIGRGGFGIVYWGRLEDGRQVAVKINSDTSPQGIKELRTEAKSLTRVHHKNLVSLIGYCIDEKCLALVYEYLQEGNLLKKLRDDKRPLSWKQRLQIAYESAQGLEYLHMACNPPVIHRDVKTSNILLTANLQPKIADFGLSRVLYDGTIVTHLTTDVAGTPGYLDPEYYRTSELTTKSDVYSFGVVLLELITGQDPIIIGPEGGHLVRWVHGKVSEGGVQSIVDPKMQNKYDINSVWMVTNLACKSTEDDPSERPTMTEVVAELKKSLDLEIAAAGMHTGGTNRLVPDVSYGSSSRYLMIDMPAASGPSMRI
ncbi:hypothetical protein LUZ61_019650 [Rhynchospora tenuis]|uniref:Protein kinase domain-containing protein n=1 Tax=Rhynchospora tenuis TaxID=198213 RepID=A0AAD5ZBQ5_9POAL|nr:hypothetical protein LUZ61_019650 [Rhynchospora tenuis]